jgi:antirestriction factor ArdC-like protein
MHSNSAKADVYEQITNAIVSAIEEGAGKYEMPWHALSTPLNVTNRKPYRGVNVLMLWAMARKHSYSSNEWATYRQWEEAGAQVRKGEHSTTVVFWKFYDARKNNKRIPMLPKIVPAALHVAITSSMQAKWAAMLLRLRSSCRNRCGSKMPIAFSRAFLPSSNTAAIRPFILQPAISFKCRHLLSSNHPNRT